MSKFLSFSLFLVFFANTAAAQKPHAWAKSSSGADDEIATSITIGKQGQVYHAGYFSGTADFDPGPGAANLTSNGLDDIYIARYDSAGNYVWAISIGGADVDQCMQIVTDDTGNVYISGYFSGTADFDPGVGINTLSCNFYNLFLAKYDSSGNYVWAKHLDGDAASLDTRIAVDKAGYIFLSGDYYSPIDFDPGPGNATLLSTGENLFFAKYDNMGNYIRASRIGDHPVQSIDLGGMVLDDQANMYITGDFASTVHLDFDPGAGYAYLYSAGQGANDVFIAKYDSAGSYLWAVSMEDTSTRKEYGTGIALGPGGDIYICGTINYYGDTTGSPYADFDPGPGVVNLAGGAGAFIARYNNAGNYIYARPLYSSFGQMRPYGIAVDAADNVYLAGTFADTVDFDPGVGVYTKVGPTVNIFLAGYDSNGQLDFAYAFGDTNVCEAKAMALDTLHNVYIAGYYTNTVDFDPGTNVANLSALQGNDLLVAKYGDSTVPSKVYSINRTNDISIYPNPAKETITVKSAAKINEVRLTNMVGQVLQTTKGNTINLRDYAPGMYFLQVTTAKGSFTSKFLKE